MTDLLTFSKAHFERIEKRADCRYCSGELPAASLLPVVDAVICISTKELPDRTRKAADHFHQIGLCRDLVFYRPPRETERGSNLPRVIWASHRNVARYALSRGFRRIIILEDDATFSRPWAVSARRLTRTITKLPDDWWGLYLGHFPLQGYFVRPNIMRVRSGCSHAYLAGPQLLQWLAETIPMDPNVPVWPGISSSIDGALANLPGMYALFPMMATQRFMGDHRVDPSFTPDGKRRSLTDKERYRPFVLFHCMRIAEIAVALLSPVHWLTMRRI
jgi:hypothetical protein